MNHSPCPPLSNFDSCKWAVVLAGAALDTFGSIDGMRCFLFTGNSTYRTVAGTFSAALAFIGINHVILHSLADMRAAFMFLNVFYIFFPEILDRT